MPAKFATTNSYTDAELLALFREAYAQIAATGQSYKIGTREYVAADLADIREEIAWLDSRINSDTAPAVNLARLARR